MQVNDGVIMSLIRGIQQLKNQCLAMILTDTEAEFEYEDNIRLRANKLLDDLRLNGKVSSDELVFLLEMLDSQLPSYAVIRKTILDGINDLARNIFQSLLGEVEGYAQRRTKRSYRSDERHGRGDRNLDRVPYGHKSARASRPRDRGSDSF
jgi:hypothetical protein